MAIELPKPIAVTPVPNVRYREFTKCGQKPLAGGKIWTYEANSTTPKVTYKDPYGITPNTNPIILDAAGEADIYLNGTYRFVVEDKNGVIQKDVAKIGSWYSGDLDDQFKSLNDALETSAQTLMQPLQDAIDTALAAGAGGAGWTANLIAYGGITQKEFNDYVKLIEVSPEMFGARGDGSSVDDVSFLNAALFAKAMNIPFRAKSIKGYYLTTSIDFYTDTQISKIIMPSDGAYRYLRVKTEKIPDTIPRSQLTGLTEFSKVITGLPISAIGHYIKITSNEILTERNNLPGNIPYYKNTIFKVIDKDGSISPSLDMSFLLATDALIQVIPYESRIDFKIGEIQVVGDGLNHNCISLNRDNVDLYLDSLSSTTPFRTIVSIEANNCNIYSPVIKDSGVYNGYGYGISIGLSCDTAIYNMSASNCRTTLDGRHGSNVTVYNSKLEVAATHWGNNYIFINCDIGEISWSGKDLEMQGGTLRNSVLMRADTSYCIGKCKLLNINSYCKSSLITPSATQIADFFTKPRRIFDEVIIDGLRCYENIASLYGYGPNTIHSADFIPPYFFKISDIYAPKSEVLRCVQLNLANAIGLTEYGIVTIDNIIAKITIPFFARGFLKYTSSYGYEVKVRNAGRVFIQSDASAFFLYQISESKFIGATRINSSVAMGEIVFHTCVIEHDSVIAPNGLFYIESKKGFMNCEYRGVFANDGPVNGVTMYSTNCRAKIGATNFPRPLLNYINRTLYIRDEVTIAFNPPSIAPNSFARQEFGFPGAQLGDAVVAAFSVYNENIKIFAYISATNKVTVVFENTSASAIDLAEGNLNIKQL